MHADEPDEEVRTKFSFCNYLWRGFTHGRYRHPPGASQ